MIAAITTSAILKALGVIFIPAAAAVCVALWHSFYTNSDNNDQ